MNFQEIKRHALYHCMKNIKGFHPLEEEKLF
jgi:hypothetical protein